MKKIILISIALYFTIFLASANITPNAVLRYEQCNILLEKNDTENIKKFGDTLCIFIYDKGGRFNVLSKKENDFGLTLINQETLAFLKKNYYRGENIEVNVQGFEKHIEQKLNFKGKDTYTTLDSDYRIKFGGDLQVNQIEFEYLNQSCRFTSYNIESCTNKDWLKLSRRINSIISIELLEKKILLELSSTQLESEQKKVQDILNKIKELEKQYKKPGYSKILFTTNYIKYQLQIYINILNNRIGDIKFKDFLKENEIYYIDKVLLGDLYISQTDQFTFFYYGNKRVNTLHTDISHFDEDELSQDDKLKNSNKQYLKQKIRKKYSAEYIQNTENKLMLITKQYLSRTKYLIFDTRLENVFSLQGNIQKIDKGKKGYYLLSIDYKQEQSFSLYDGENIHTIIETKGEYNIINFELLIGKKIRIYYTLKDGSKSDEIITISEY